MKNNTANDIEDYGVYVLISPLDVSILKNINKGKEINHLKQKLSKHKQRKIKRACHQLCNMGLIKISKSHYYITNDGKRALKNYEPLPSNGNQHKIPLLLKFVGVVLVILFIMGLISLAIVRNA